MKPKSRNSPGHHSKSWLKLVKTHAKKPTESCQKYVKTIKNSLMGLVKTCLLIQKVNYWTVHPETLSSWPPVCLLLASKKVVNFFICKECCSFCAFEFCTGKVRLDSRIRYQNVHLIIKSKENYLLQFFFSCRISSSSHINFAVRISSRAVSVFPALSLRRVRLSYGTFFLMVFQGNFIRVRTGHMIKNRILH